MMRIPHDGSPPPGHPWVTNVQEGTAARERHPGRLRAHRPKGERMNPKKSPTKVAAGVVGGAAAAVAGTKLVQKVVGQVGKTLGADPDQPNRATQTLTISAPADEIFGFGRDATNFQRVLRNVVEVQPAGERSVHWTVPGPDGHDLQLDAELTEERPGELLRWTSGGSAGLKVRLRPSPVGGGTAVTMRLEP